MNTNTETSRHTEASDMYVKLITDFTQDAIDKLASLQQEEEDIQQYFATSTHEDDAEASEIHSRYLDIEEDTAWHEGFLSGMSKVDHRNEPPKGAPVTYFDLRGKFAKVKSQYDILVDMSIQNAYDAIHSSELKIEEIRKQKLASESYGELRSLDVNISYHRGVIEGIIVAAPVA